MRVLLILLLFIVIHSITITQTVKRACKNFFGEIFVRVFYRALYNTISFITVGVAFYVIQQQLDRQLWIAPGWLRWAMHGIQAAGLVFGMRAFQYLDIWEFMGLRQIWRYVVRRDVAGNDEGLRLNKLVTEGVYGIVRHPLYLSGIVLFTFNPFVTVNRLTVTIIADLYFIFGMFIEERRFLKIFGDQYYEYMKHVPRFVPKLTSRKKSRLA